MSSDWQELTLADIAEPKGGLVDGPFGSNLPASCYAEKGVPVIRGSNLTVGLERFKSNDFVYVSNETLIRIKRSECLPNDIVFTKKGTLGQTGIVPFDSRYEKYLLSSNQMRLRVNTNLADPEYVYYWVSSKASIEKIKRDSEFTGVPKINLDYLKKFPIVIPKLTVQKKISKILSGFDHIIELNRQINQTLEAMAQAIFKSWFVDFEPVKAKISTIEAGEDTEGVTRAAMSAISGKTNEELDQLHTKHAEHYIQLKTTAELFPAAMQNSGFGEIPEGWKVYTVDEILELAYGKPLKEDTRLPGNIPVYGSNGQIGWHNQKLVDGPGIVIGRKGNPGTVTWVHTHFYPIDTTFYAIPKGPVKSLYYLLYVLKKQKLPFLAADSAVPGLNRNMVYMNKMIVPQRDILDLFDIQITKIYQKIQVNREQSEVFAAIREILLPKLLSGELSVDAADVVEVTNDGAIGTFGKNS
jgi:type I restriction enzyme, S subunit